MFDTMRGKSLTVSSWVGIRGDCPIMYRVNDSDAVEFMAGGTRDGFEFVLDARTLDTFIRLGTHALQEMAALGEQERSATPDGWPA